MADMWKKHDLYNSIIIVSREDLGHNCIGPWFRHILITY